MGTVLIVDDSQFQRSFLRRALEPGGHRILEARTGKEALELTHSERPDCVLADLIMPETDEMFLLQNLKGTEIPILVVTADIQRQVREQCLALGARQVINKPVEPERLREAVEEALTGQGQPA